MVMVRMNKSSTLRQVYNDSKTKLLGYVGTIKDMTEAGLIPYTGKRCNLSETLFLCEPISPYSTRNGFGKTAADAVKNAVFKKEDLF